MKSVGGWFLFQGGVSQKSGARWWFIVNSSSVLNLSVARDPWFPMEASSPFCLCPTMLFIGLNILIYTYINHALLILWLWIVIVYCLLICVKHIPLLWEWKASSIYPVQLLIHHPANNVLWKALVPGLDSTLISTYASVVLKSRTHQTSPLTSHSLIYTTYLYAIIYSRWLKFSNGKMALFISLL